MTVGGRSGNANRSRYFAQTKTVGSALGQQAETSVDECSAQIAVMIAPRF
ncbi:hypothetical protein [Devosia sp. DBB001]|nr:hypothetical protein [Devosia sp. DBB001]